MTPNAGIFEDGRDAAFLHGAPPTEHDYHSPHLLFQKWSWLAGYADGIKMRLEFQNLKEESK